MYSLINRVLSQKSISQEDELADALGEMAIDIAIFEPNPVDWEGWVAYLLDEDDLRDQGKQNLKLHLMVESKRVM